MQLMRKSFKKKDVVKRYVDRKGKKRVVGGKGLKGTQVYPKGYAKKVRNMILCIVLPGTDL